MKRQTLIIGVLAVLLISGLSIAGCGSGSTAMPTQEPTRTPTQEPTQTPTQEPTQTPTPRPTQTPTQRPTQKPTQRPTETPSVKYTDLAGVCDGTGATETTPYTRTAGLHPIVYANTAGKAWSAPTYGYVPPSEWKPKELSKVELVACVKESTVNVQRCSYTLSSGQVATLDRVRVDFSVTLRETQTGKVVGQKAFTGKSPDPCPATTKFAPGTTSQTYRGAPASADLETWLKRYVVIP